MLVGAEDGAVRGAFDLRRDEPHRFGYVLARRCWGQGLMPEALAAVAEWALAQPGVFRFNALCDAENLASARAMEKAGLVREGLLRRRSVHPNIGDEPRDLAARLGCQDAVMFASRATPVHSLAKSAT